MKLALFLSLSLSGFFALAVDYKDVEITTKTKVAVLAVDVACVEYINSEGESDGGPIPYFYLNSYAQVSALASQGLTSVFLQNEVCLPAEKVGTLTYVTVPTFATSGYVNGVIEKNGGYKNVKAVFYDSQSLNKNFDGALKSTFESIK